MKICPCGCDRELLGQRTKYADGQKCRNRHEVLMLLSGCTPVDKILFSQCSHCDKPIISLKAKPQRTCSQMTGSKCGQMQGKHRTGKKKPSINKLTKELPKICKSARRLKHISTYCIQEHGQCREYARGFNIDNLDGGCWGKRCTFSCYQRPRHGIQTGGRDELAKTHRLDFRHYHGS